MCDDAKEGYENMKRGFGYAKPSLARWAHSCVAMWYGPNGTSAAGLSTASERSALRASNRLWHLVDDDG